MVFGKQVGNQKRRTFYFRSIENDLKNDCNLEGVLGPSWDGLVDAERGFGGCAWGSLRQISARNSHSVLNTPKARGRRILTLRAPAEAMPVAGGSMAGWLGGSLARWFGRLVATLNGGFAAG